MRKATALAVAGITGLFTLGILLPVIGNVRGVTSSKRTTQATMPFLQAGLRLYVHEYGSLPSTTENSEILEILRGKNPLRAQFCSITDAEHVAGRFLDGWERPYVFEKTPDNLRIRSAGADGIYHTKDDLTLSTLPHQQK